MAWLSQAVCREGGSSPSAPHLLSLSLSSLSLLVPLSSRLSLSPVLSLYSLLFSLFSLFSSLSLSKIIIYILARVRVLEISEFLAFSEI